MRAKGYLIAELEVLDAAKFEDEYSVHVRPLLSAYGATFAINSANVKVLEGNRDVHKIVVVQFDDLATATAFYDSAEYRALLPARERWARGHVYLVEGTAPA